MSTSKETNYESSRKMPVNSADPDKYEETPTNVTITYQKKETKPTQ